MTQARALDVITYATAERMTLTDPQEDHAAQGRLMILTAMEAAIYRHAEVSAVISAAADRAEAITAVRHLLGLDARLAEHILEMPWRWLTAEGVATLASEVAQQAVALRVVVTPHQPWRQPGIFPD